MKTCKITQSLVIEATDQYWNDVHCKWLPVPKFWIGDLAVLYSHKITSAENAGLDHHSNMLVSKQEQKSH